jgi:predicted aldo/keto reductase-like oxidoreductase
LENTLKKLRSDYLDLYLVHGIGAGSWEGIKERKIFAEFEKFKAEGLIRTIGFSYHVTFELFKEVVSAYPWDFCQVQYNMLDINREVTDAGLAYASKLGVAVAVMEPLRGGGLSQAPGPVKEVYDGYPVKRSPSEWAFRHVLDKPEVSTILSGMTTLEQLKENIAIFSQKDIAPGCMSAEEKAVVAKARAAYESIVTIPCTACNYCMPCPQGVGIPGVFGIYNNAHRFQHFDSARRSYYFAVKGSRDASKCVECGQCAPKCPQNIAIPDELKKAHRELKGWNE